MCESLSHPLHRRRNPRRGLRVLGRLVYAPGYSGEEGQLGGVPICLRRAGETLAIVHRYTDTQLITSQALMRDGAEELIQPNKAARLLPVKVHSVIFGLI